HFDIHMENVILGDDGQLWLIDWEEAGWYPRWFESASMRKYAKMAKTPWASWVSFIAGICEQTGQYPFIRAMGYSLDALMPTIKNSVSQLLFKIADVRRQIDSEIPITSEYPYSAFR
ncbi:hypothetical protein GGU11DRAFT_682868, partial [Lentinula aff. detonsa]